jgi:hypothetical protein
MPAPPAAGEPCRRYEAINAPIVDRHVNQRGDTEQRKPIYRERHNCDGLGRDTLRMMNAA